jgi:hypothetical protein
MNRLIIIGNGFDLAHGIKSSYHDFVLAYLKTSCIEAINGGRKQYYEPSFNQLFHFKDELIEVKIGIQYDVSQLSEKLIQLVSIVDFNEFVKRFGIEINYDFKLLKNGIQKITEYNWVDFEIEYFNLLLATKHAFKDNNQLKEIIIINNQLDFLKNKLIEYLEQQQRFFSNLYDNIPLIKCFTETIYPYEIVTVKLEEKQLPEKLYFLNFNYTNTFENYMNECKKIIPSDFNYIHGDLTGTHGKPIFGFGDELDKRYLEFEDEKNNQLFKHIKSFEYLKTKNYSLLTRFIESEHFQVHIYGHSCGLSDRTMLNQIFEHNNCKSIKIFYHKINDDNNDYTEKTYEMSRHFKDKGMMRKKVISFDRSRSMPQPNNIKI